MGLTTSGNPESLRGLYGDKFTFYRFTLFYCLKNRMVSSSATLSYCLDRCFETLYNCPAEPCHFKRELDWNGLYVGSLVHSLLTAVTDSARRVMIHNGCDSDLNLREDGTNFDLHISE
jgi:hypothetical protein